MVMSAVKVNGIGRFMQRLADDAGSCRENRMRKNDVEGVCRFGGQQDSL